MRFTSNLKKYQGTCSFKTMSLAVFREFRDAAREMSDGRQVQDKTAVDVGMFYDAADQVRYVNLADLPEVVRFVTDVDLTGPEGEPFGLDAIKDATRCPYPVAIWLLLCYSEWLGRSLSFFRASSDDVGVSE